MISLTGSISLWLIQSTPATEVLLREQRFEYADMQLCNDIAEEHEGFAMTREPADEDAACWDSQDGQSKACPPIEYGYG
jgi:hypothetical protein